MDTVNEKKIYEIVETLADEIGDWRDDLSQEQVEAFIGEYESIQYEALTAAYPEIEFVIVNNGQRFIANAHNIRLEEYDSIVDFMDKHFVLWLETASEKVLSQ